MLVANARMYAVNAGVRAAWAELFALVSEKAGVPLAVVEHAAPAPLEELWRREDLGLAFICGFPLAGGGFPLQPIAAPIPASPLASGQPLYASDLIVRTEGPLRTLQDTFGGRIGWTSRHSQSGFQALRRHLLPYAKAFSSEVDTGSREENASKQGARAIERSNWIGNCSSPGGPLYRESIGELMTPRRVIEAVLDDRIDIGPLDSYFHDLLKRHEPGTAARLRVVATTQATPMPLLAASNGIDPASVAALRGALLGLGAASAAEPVLAELCLTGFATVALDDYRPLLAQAAVLDKSGYGEPG
ncbi:phosphate/phosphite/phosphonate ABC transporter substrate-binding protein [Bosea sp. 685]|uniref:phosphate/phosphite/phosphonate ABC transporter substrate-binding protein n=1 Tax=Bosea sp. 685 TaxID=3080057 RepID=UPI0028934AAE|nr:PhnD/SsuA/transferrin family substrate-binding protein [Bosea sp. 685]WNJ89997.1 PhnD/SsuA/transferrin family substrate-binding protein [Bosea sp. 685]